MRRIAVYLGTFILLVGCKSAAERGYDKGCEKGTLQGRSDGQEDRRTCAAPEPFTSGCNVAGKGLLRREKFDDAHDAAYLECYTPAYDAEYTEADYAACRDDTGEGSLLDTGDVD
jgi:hypothetical protein